MSAVADAFAAAADALDANADEFTRLDSLQGDGDLGRTAGLIAGALRTAVAEHVDDPVALLRACGMRISGAAPSSSGTLIAGGFLSASKALADPDGGGDLVAALAGGIAGIQQRGKAQPGDRTMLDALAPALTALQENPEGRELAANAAETGIEATRTMEARFGRARFLSKNATGEPDPGAAMVGMALAAALRAG